MRQQWGRTDEAGTWPHPKPVWILATLVAALLSAAAIGAYRYAVVWTPLQRLYVATYLRSELMGGLEGPVDDATSGLRRGGQMHRSSHGSKPSDGELRQRAASCQFFHRVRGAAVQDEEVA